MGDLVKQGAFCHAVVIRKSKVYGGCAIVDAVVKTQNGYDSIEPHDHIQIVVEFGTDKARRKSWVRSTFKLGDLFEIWATPRCPRLLQKGLASYFITQPC